MKKGVAYKKKRVQNISRTIGTNLDMAVCCPLKISEIQKQSPRGVPQKRCP